MDRCRSVIAGVCIGSALVVACTGKPSTTAPSSPYQVGTGGNFAKIQDAVNLAPEGSVVEVLAGTYAERVVVRKSLKLRASNAVVDGAGVGGTGIGILVADTANVELSGFTVQNFERGVVFQNVSNSVLKGNEVRNSTAKGTGPITIGVTPFEGIVLIASRNNEVTENFSHHNGHDGLMVTEGSSGNRIRNNRFTDNGAQTPTSVGWGINLFSGPGNTSNEITDNQVLRNHWGILINAPSLNATANIIRSNTVRDNGRAGVGILGTAIANIVENNNVIGNGLLNLAPSMRFDLFAAVPANNTWRNNQGNPNFTTSSLSTEAAYAAEAFGPGGCMGPAAGTP